MSLITNPPSNAPAIALKIMSIPSEKFSEQLATWREGMDLLWDGDTEAILEAFGTRGAEVFATSNIAVTYLENLVPGCTADRIAKVRPYTIAENGVVTLS